MTAGGTLCRPLRLNFRRLIAIKARHCEVKAFHTYIPPCYYKATVFSVFIFTLHCEATFNAF